MIFRYTIAASSFKYTFSVNTTSRTESTSGEYITTLSPQVITENITFSSEESGTVTMNVSVLGTLTSDIKAVHGERPNVTGVKIWHSNGTPSDSMDLALNVGYSEYLIAEVIPNTAGNKNVTWTSDNEEVAEVSSSGRVEAKRPGSAAITVTTQDGNFTALCRVKVTDQYAARAITISPSELEMEPGDKESITIASDLLFIRKLAKSIT